VNKVIILGGGLSGLGCGRTLPNAEIYEASSHPGGVAFSPCEQGVHFDQGAHICHSKDDDWLQMLYAQTEVRKTEKSCVANYWNGHWISYPVQNHLFELPLEVRASALHDLVAALVVHRDHVAENYYQWCLFRYGQYLTDHFYALYTRKYWRVSMDTLAVNWLRGRVLAPQLDRIIRGALMAREEDQTVFQSFHYPKSGGFFSFFEPLYREISIQYNMQAVAVDTRQRIIRFANGAKRPYSTLVSSIPLPDLVRMLDHVPSAVSEAADGLKGTKICCINLVVQRKTLGPWHWFYIYDADIQAARVSVGSNLSPGSCPSEATSIQVEIFRRSDEAMPDESTIQRTIRQLADILEFDVDTDLMQKSVFYVPYAYPINDMQRTSRVKLITDWLRSERGIHTMGLTGTWTYVWSDIAYQSGVQAAEAVREYL